TYVWGAYDNMWPEFLPDYGTTPDSRDVMPAFGNAAGKYFLQQSSWPSNTSNKAVTYNLFHHHGDAFMTVYSEIPQDLTVMHNPILYTGVTSFDVTANDGAFIALTVNGEIIGTAEATGGPVSITIPAQQPPDEMLVTITMQNYYRYEQIVEIIPPDGPYVVYHSVEINDEAGNGNGIMETSESILASVTLENVGVEDAENVTVTISTDDEYVTITDDTEDYGTIAAGATAVVEDGFAWDVADNIPDYHMVIFEVNATDGTDIWTTSFSVVGHGPNLEVGMMTIDDSQGNGNGRLDPGETVDIYIETYNTGSYHAIGAIGSLSSSSGYLTLNTSSYDFNVIGSGLMEEAEFNITVAANAPVGTSVSLMYDVTSGGYNVQENFATSIGIIVEDWETGDMSQYDWTTGGNAVWTVSQENPYEGMYCAKSGDISDQQNTWLELEYEVFSDDVISFWYKVSSEASYDYLRFYIDNNEQASWAGEVGWAEAEFDVTAGMHTFKWKYDKDYSVSNGGDCAWIDYILLPSPPMTTAYAGPDETICEGDDYSCEGVATLYNAVNWSTSGTGTFDYSQNLTAIYTPSADDIAGGSVTLSLTAYGPDNTVTDEMLLTINAAAMANAGEDATVCSDASYELINATAENYVSVEWTTSGDGTFDDNYIINPLYTPGTEDIEAGTVTLTFTVNANEPCAEAMDDMMLTIEQGATAFAGTNTEACSNVAIALSEATAENYASVEWSTTGDGTFNDITLINPEYTPGAEDASNGEVTLTLTAMGIGSCGEVTSDIVLTVMASPMAFAGEDNQINYDQTYTAEDASAENYNSVTWTTSGDGTFDDANSVNPTYTPGTNDIEAAEVVLTMTATNDDCGDVSDDMTLAISPMGVYENLAGFDIAIFPNPNTGQFSIELNGNSNEIVNISLYNSLGDVVYKAENVRINKSYSETLNLDVEQGVYYLRIEGKELLLNKKIIIQK
ncbi:MAG: T9SS type A sorting domain-containing protein, partial [Bacteroidetes bacterium]|nr:T9SS type A sorting domain-containing protein [Bacteroidota bacterium]